MGIRELAKQVVARAALIGVDRAGRSVTVSDETLVSARKVGGTANDILVHPFATAKDISGWLTDLHRDAGALQVALDADAKRSEECAGVWTIDAVSDQLQMISDMLAGSVPGSKSKDGRIATHKEKALVWLPAPDWTGRNTRGLLSFRTGRIRMTADLGSRTLLWVGPFDCQITTGVRTDGGTRITGSYSDCYVTLAGKSREAVNFPIHPHVSTVTGRLCFGHQDVIFSNAAMTGSLSSAVDIILTGLGVYTKGSAHENLHQVRLHRSKYA